MEEILNDDTIISFVKYRMGVCIENGFDVHKDEDYNKLLDFSGYIENLAEIKRYFNHLRDFYELPYWDDDTFPIEDILTKLEI